MRKCKNCNSEVSLIYSYCTKCGKNEFIDGYLHCKNCNSIYFKGDNFCYKCGENLKAVELKSFNSVEEAMEDYEKNYKWYDHLEIWWWRCPIYKLYKFITDTTPRAIKRFVQRGIRGWTDEDLWGMSYFLTDIILNMLVELKSKKNGYQIIDDKKSDEENEKLWNDILDKIIIGFAIMKKCDEGELELGIYCNEEQKKHYNETIGKKFSCRMTSKTEDLQIKEAFRLLAENYFSLWD